MKNEKEDINFAKIRKELDITREKVLKTKKTIKTDFKLRKMQAYNEMLGTCINPIAVMRASFVIPSTKYLVWLLNAIIFTTRVLIIVIIILLFKKQWYWAMGLAIIDYILSAYVQTELNFEIASRVVTVDKEMTKKKPDLFGI